MTDESSLVFGGIFSSRGEDLAGRLLKLQSYALNEQQLQLVRDTAQLMNSLSPMTASEPPTYEALAQVCARASELQIETAGQAGFPRLPNKNELLTALRQESRAAAVRAYVLVIAIQKALALGMATVSTEPPLILRMWHHKAQHSLHPHHHRAQYGQRRQLPFVRDHKLAQDCHQQARKLLELLSPA